MTEVAVPIMKSHCFDKVKLEMFFEITNQLKPTTRSNTASDLRHWLTSPADDAQASWYLASDRQAGNQFFCNEIQSKPFRGLKNLVVDLKFLPDFEHRKHPSSCCGMYPTIHIDGTLQELDGKTVWFELRRIDLSREYITVSSTTMEFQATFCIR